MRQGTRFAHGRAYPHLVRIRTSTPQHGRVGLGVPDFERFVPHNRLKRLTRLQSSPVPAVREAFLAHGQKILAGAARAVEKDRLKQSYATALHASVDGSELKLCSENSASVAYMRAPQGIAGKEFKQYARIRINAKPSRNRVSRGKNGPTMCRACEMPSETHAHIVQNCLRTHEDRLMRHDAIVKRLVGGLNEKGYRVESEFTFYVWPRLTTMRSVGHERYVASDCMRVARLCGPLKV